MSTFFTNVNTKLSPPKLLSVGDKIYSLKARSVLIDMEEGVVDKMLNSKFGKLFDNNLRLTDVSGSGNNWGRGFYEYGDLYQDKILEKIRIAVEKCDSIQCFFLLHSLGGGTGSGLGTRILKEIYDNYKSVYKFTCSVFPSENDDVVISPYNSILSLKYFIIILIVN